MILPNLESDLQKLEWVCVEPLLDGKFVKFLSNSGWVNLDASDVDILYMIMECFINHGLHVCIGRELAKLEARVTLMALRNRYPNLRLVNEGERVGPFLFWGRSKLPVTHQ